MKKYLKIFSVLLAFCLSFSLAGCGNKSNLTTQEVVAEVHDLINFENLNFTINGDGNFEISYKSFGEPKETTGYSVEDMVIKVAGNNTYLFIPEYGENYQIGDYKYSNEYEFNYDENEFELGDFYITNSYGLFENLDVEEVVKELFYDVFSFSNLASSEKQSDGGYKLNLNVDVKAIFDGIKTALSENLENPMIEIVNDILAVFYSDLTVESLVADLKDAIDEESTIQDLFDFIEAKLNLRLSNTFNFIFSMLSDGEFEGYDFTENFYSYFDIANDAVFAEMLDGVVESLSDDEYTIQKILDAVAADDDLDALDYLESAPFFAGILMEVYDIISDIEINNFNIDASITTNSTISEISKLTFAIKGEICAEDYLTIGYDINFDFNVSDVGTTQVSLPDSFEICGIDLDYVIETELTEDEAYVYENINFGDTDLEFSYSPFEGSLLFLSYDASEGTLTLSAEAVNYLLDNYYSIYFEGIDEDFSITFYYDFEDVV